MLKLYYVPGTCALASHIALEEAGADYQAVRLSFATEDQRKPEYLAINPKGRVPALATDRGVLSETPAILAFIAQRFPAADLAPVDPFDFAEVQAFNAYLCSTVHIAHAHRPRASRWTDDEAAIKAIQAKVPQNMTDCFDMIENRMFRGPWVMGDRYTIADPYLFTITRWLEGDSVEPRRFAKVWDHHGRMLDRPAVARVLAAQTA